MGGRPAIRGRFMAKPAFGDRVGCIRALVVHYKLNFTGWAFRPCPAKGKAPPHSVDPFVRGRG